MKAAQNCHAKEILRDKEASKIIMDNIKGNVDEFTIIFMGKVYISKEIK